LDTKHKRWISVLLPIHSECFMMTVVTVCL